MAGLGPSLSTVDWSAWQTWPQVTVDGLVFYQVPGNPGVIYDPRSNKWLYDQREAAKRKAEEAKKAATPSFGQQVAPIAGGIVGTAGGVAAGKYAADYFGSSGTEAAKTGAQAAQNGGLLASNGTGAAGAGASAAAPQAPAGGVLASGSTPPPQPQSVPIQQGATTGPNGEVITEDGTAIDPQTGQVVGRVVQGAVGAYLVYSGVQKWQDGDKAGGAADVGFGATMGASALGSTAASAALPYVGAAYGAYQAYDMAKDAGKMNKGDTGRSAARGAAAGAAVGSVLPGVGTVIGAAVGGLYGAALGLTASGKGGGQQIRDKWRKAVINSGSPLINQDFKGTLADGTVIDWNNINGEQGSGVKNMHFEDPIVAQAVSYADMLATAQGATGKARQNIAGEIAKAAIANANGDPRKVEDNIRHFAAQLGLDGATIQQRISEIEAQEVDEDSPEKERSTFAVAKVNAEHLFGTPAGQQPQAPVPQAAPPPMQRPTPQNMPSTQNRGGGLLAADNVTWERIDQKRKNITSGAGRSPYVRR